MSRWQTRPQSSLITTSTVYEVKNNNKQIAFYISKCMEIQESFKKTCSCI